MFNKTNYVTVGQGPSYITKTTTEYRAPTDESVRLLKEMEEKALDKLIDSISIRDSQVDCQILVEKSYIDQTNHYIIVYSINGKKSKIKTMIHEQEIQDRHLIIAERLRDLLAKDIATTMIGDAFAKGLKL